MIEYITKEQARDALLYLDDDLAFVPEDRIEEISNAWNDEIRRLPAADVAPVVQARWIDKTEEPGEGYWECSNCGLAWVLNDGTPVENEMHFCPKCGARMDGEEK